MGPMGPPGLWARKKVPVVTPVSGPAYGQTMPSGLFWVYPYVLPQGDHRGLLTSNSMGIHRASIVGLGVIQRGSITT